MLTTKSLIMMATSATTLVGGGVTVSVYSFGGLLETAVSNEDDKAIAYSPSTQVQFAPLNASSSNSDKINRLTSQIASVNGSLVSTQGLLQQANNNLEVTIGQITKTSADVTSNGKNLKAITKTLSECEAKLTKTEPALKLATKEKTTADRAVSLQTPIVFSYTHQRITAQTTKTPQHTEVVDAEKREKDKLDRFINTALEKEAEYSTADKTHNAASAATRVAKANKANLQKEKTQKESNLSTLLQLKAKKDAEIASLRSTIESLNTQLATLNNELAQAKLSSGQ